MQTPRAFFLPALLAAAVLAACGGDDDDDHPVPVTPPVTVGDSVALTVSGSIVSFDRATPATLKGSIALKGLQANEKLVGLDLRPADGLLYALSDQARLYTLDPSTGVATFKIALIGRRRRRQPLHRAHGQPVRRRLQPRCRPAARHQRHRPEPAH